MDNDYGIFGWCTIPSKTMVNMEYNEHALIVPSSYDHHNRIGSNNFLQLDNDLNEVYKVSDGGQTVQHNADQSWCYLYSTRDWTYFMKPVFNVSRNNSIYESRLQSWGDLAPENSDHINGIIYERAIE